jgi:hypothetical protein
MDGRGFETQPCQQDYFFFLFLFFLFFLILPRLRTAANVLLLSALLQDCEHPRRPAATAALAVWAAFGPTDTKGKVGGIESVANQCITPLYEKQIFSKGIQKINGQSYTRNSYYVLYTEIRQLEQRGTAMNSYHSLMTGLLPGSSPLGVL